MVSPKGIREMNTRLPNKDEIDWIGSLITGYWIVGDGMMVATYHVPTKWEKFKAWFDGKTWKSTHRLRREYPPGV